MFFMKLPLSMLVVMATAREVITVKTEWLKSLAG